MNSGLVARPFEEKDYAAITKYCLPKEQAIYTSLPIDVIKAFKNDRNNQPFVVYLHDNLVGCFALGENQYTSNENAIILKSLSIDSRYQKKGYALNTLRLLPDILKIKYPEKNEIILTVHHTNSPAINLYIKAGFIDNGLRFQGDYGEELIFHYALDRE
jgi:RimJ/RimL family protein N-acetyltransferase